MVKVKIKNKPNELKAVAFLGRFSIGVRLKNSITINQVADQLFSIKNWKHNHQSSRTLK